MYGIYTKDASNITFQTTLRWEVGAVDGKGVTLHNGEWSPETRLKGSTDSLVAGIQQKPHRKLYEAMHLLNIAFLTSQKTHLLKKSVEP